MKKATWIVVALAVSALAAPQVVLAATGSFTSSTGTPAVTGSSTYSTGGKGVYGKASGSTARGVHGYATHTGTGITTGVLGQTSSKGYNFEGTYGNYATGVKGVASATTGEPYTNGVWGTANSVAGTGVFGTSPGWGVYGVGGIYGVYADGDLGTAGHLYQDWAEMDGDDVRSDIAGTCTIAEATAERACAFPTAFALGTTPIVVVTPTTNPGAQYWVNATESGLTITMPGNVSAAVTFNYVVVGVLQAPSSGLGTTADGGKPHRSR